MLLRKTPQSAPVRLETGQYLMNNKVRNNLIRWCRANDVELCVLFGSRAKGTPHQESDWDVALLSRRQPDLQRQWLRLNGELEDLFGYPIDLVILDRDADPALRLEVFQNGRPLFEARAGLFLEHHIHSIRLFEDTEWLRRRRDQVLAQRILNLKNIDRSKYATPRR